jgi:hypothetical protein
MFLDLLVERVSTGSLFGFGAAPPGVAGGS